MTEYKTSPDALAEWLKAECRAAEVHYVLDLERGSVLFRIVNRSKSPFPQLEVADEALEDWDFGEIVEDLRGQGLPSAVGAPTPAHLWYDNDRVLRTRL